MAIIYCDSAGSNTSPYDTWAKAATTLSTAIGAWSSGDVIYVKKNSNVGGQTSSLTLSGGTDPDVIPIYSVTCTICDGTDDTYSASTTNNINISDDYANLAVNGGFNLKGLNLASNYNFTRQTTASLVMEDCKYAMTRSGAAFLHGGNNYESKIILNSCSLALGVGGRAFLPQPGQVEINGLVVTGTVTSSGLFVPSGSYGSGAAVIAGLDLSGATFSSAPLVDASAGKSFHVKFVNSDIPSGLTITDSGEGQDGKITELVMTASSDKVYDYAMYTYRASLITDTAVYLTGGFTPAGSADPVSHAITPTSVFKDGARFEGPWLTIYNDTTGSSQTITIESCDDFTGSSPNQNEAYLEVAALETTSEALATIITGRPTDLIATTALASTSKVAADWQSPTGWAGHKMTVDFTAQEAGWLKVRVVLEGDFSGETANTFWYDPKPTIT